VTQINAFPISKIIGFT